MYVFMYVCMHACMHTHTHIYIYIHILTIYIGSVLRAMIDILVVTVAVGGFIHLSAAQDVLDPETPNP